MKTRKPIVAIDGPVGSGKTTTARKVAELLGFMYVDTGAMYRAVTLDVLNKGVDPSDEKGVEKVLSETEINISFTEEGQRTFLNNVDVSERIRDMDVTRAVSAVSAMKCVRERMTDLQYRIGRNGGIVMEGRDIGTVVFPDAEFKIYLDASLEVRAKRRYDEIKGKHNDISLEDMKKEIRERDRANMERNLAPLRKASGAVVIDTTHMTLDEQVSAIISVVREEKS